MSHEISPAIKSSTSCVCETVACAGGSSSLACMCVCVHACGAWPQVCALQPGRSAYQLEPDAQVPSSSPAGLGRTEPGRKRR